MGLDIRPGGAHWAYSGFLNFRERLAEAEGLNLWEMEGFADAPEWVHRGRGSGPAKPWTRDNGEHVTPLAPLINHSDCDGYLTRDECEEVLPRLWQIISSWPPYDYDRVQAEFLADGMTHSIEHGCAVVFA